MRLLGAGSCLLFAFWVPLLLAFTVELDGKPVTSMAASGLGRSEVAELPEAVSTVSWEVSVGLPLAEA